MVERIAGRKDDSDHRFIAPERAELRVQPGKHALAGTRAHDDQELRTDVADEANQRDSIPFRDRPEHERDEDGAHDIELSDQLA